MSHGHMQVREMDKLAVGVSKPQRVFAGYARRPLTGRDYMTLVERGCFKEERVELIDGEVVTTMMSPMREPHAWVIQALTQFFAKHANDAWSIRVQLPLGRMDSTSMPEPDLAIVAGDFKQRRLHPPESALLVIEASDSTVALDRGAKSSAYAALGVREYWLVDINGERLEIRSKPAPSEAGTGWKYEVVEIYEKSARNSAGVAPHFDSALIVPWDYMFAEAAEQ